MTMGPPDDEELLRRIADGDTDAFGVLYDRYARPAFSLALRIVGDGRSAEDVVQEAFVNVWRMARSFDQRRGPARSWLLGTVHHRAVDFYRRARGRQVADVPLSEHLASEGDDLWRRVTLAVDGEALHAALGQLPVDQREAIEMAYFQGYTHREIADARGLPLGTVKSRIRIGMDKLRESMKSRRPDV